MGSYMIPHWDEDEGYYWTIEQKIMHPWRWKAIRRTMTIHGFLEIRDLMLLIAKQIWNRLTR